MPGLRVFNPAEPKEGFLVGLAVKDLSSMQKTWVQSLGQEDPLEKKMATHCSILAWEISRTEGPGRLQSIGSQTVKARLTE